MENDNLHSQSFNKVRLDLYHTTTNSSTFGNSVKVSYTKVKEIILTPPDAKFSGETEEIFTCRICNASFPLVIEYLVVAILNPELLLQVYKDESPLAKTIIKKLLRSSLIPFYFCLATSVIGLILFFFVFQEPISILIKIFIPLVILFLGILISYYSYKSDKRKIGRYSARFVIKNIEQSRYFNSLEGVKIRTFIYKVEKIQDYQTIEDKGFINEKTAGQAHYITSIKSEMILNALIRENGQFPIFDGLILYPQYSYLNSNTFIYKNEEW